MQEKFNPPERLSDAQELADAGEDITPTDLHASDAALDAAGGVSPHAAALDAAIQVVGPALMEVLAGITGDPDVTDPALTALGDWRAGVDSEPIPDDDIQALVARNLLAALRAAQVAEATLNVPVERFGAWVELLDVKHIKATWTPYGSASVHVWAEPPETARPVTWFSTWCTEITGYDIAEGGPTITIPATEVGRLVVPATEGGAL